MSSYRTLDDAKVKTKRVLVRLDLNVPMKNGEVTDITRIERSVPTIRELRDKGARIILCSHFGRPKGEVVPEMSLEALLKPLYEILGVPVGFASDCIGPAAVETAQALADGDILLLENTRFHGGEEKNDPAFAKALAQTAELYVNDAFSAAHRAHASTEGVAHLLPAFAGRAMEAELEALSKALTAPQRPVVAVVGGAKVSTKLDLLNNLISRVDAVVIGGGMANTFLAAQGRDVGKSLCEHDLSDTARAIMEKAEGENCEIVLPADVVVAKAFEAGAANRTVGLDEVGADEMILDVGPQSIARFESLLGSAHTVVWNGPLGAFEIEPFDVGTNRAAQLVAMRTGEGGVTSVAGGGDTVAALNKAGVTQRFSYVSTAGGAFLEWLEGKELPGVKVLEKAG